MSYRNRIKKSRKHLKPPYWLKINERITEPEWFLKRYGVTSHKAAYNTNYYSDAIDPLSGKYNGGQENAWKERGLKKRHRFYARKVIAEQLLFMEEMKPCSYCGSDFCENPLSCKDEEEILCKFEIEIYDRMMEDYSLDEDEWEYDYKCDYHEDEDYWY